MKRNSYLLIAALTIMTIVIAILSSIKKPPDLVISVAPDTSVIKLDGQVVKTGYVYSTPGKHTVSASLSGFADNFKTVNVVSNASTEVSLVLVPNSSEGYDYLNKHPDQQLKREALGGQQFSKIAESNSRRNPLVSELPFIDRLFRVDYGVSTKNPDDPTAVTIYVTYYSAAGKKEALDWLVSKGQDVSKLDITYIDDAQSSQSTSD